MPSRFSALTPDETKTRTVRHRRGGEGAVAGWCGPQQIALVGAAAGGLAEGLHLPALGYLGGGVEALAAIGGLALWWMPYLASVTAPWATTRTGVTWAELHARTYAQTLIVLPRIGNRPRPNVEHMILHIRLLGATITTFAATATIT